MNRTVWAVVMAAGVALAGGCGNSKPTRSLGEEHKGALEELGEVLKGLATEGGKPPAKLAELEPLEPRLPVAGPAIRNGTIVYQWGAGYAAGGTQVVAYEKAAADAGGYVLLQDGTVKKLSAAEFQSAPKAK
jgi:hypothetical protein